MKKYCAFFRMRLIAGLQYRTAALAGLSTQFVWGSMEILLYSAFYRENPQLFPMGMEALASYIWLQQAFLTFFMIWQFEPELMEAVRSGAVAYELLRPVNVYGMWMTRSMALRLSRGALRCWPILLAGALLPSPYGLRPRMDAGSAVLFLISAVLMLVVACAYAGILYAVPFFVTDPSGFQTVSVAAADLLGGGVVPLPFMPGALRKIAELSPFGAMQNVPLRIFGGDLIGAAAVQAVLLQCFWSITLVCIGGAMTRWGIRRVCIAGG